MLRERAGAALQLERLAPLERAAGGRGQLPHELEVVVGERALLGEEDDDQPAALAACLLHRYGEQRAGVRRGERLVPAGEALVVGEPWRREHALIRRRQLEGLEASVGGEQPPQLRTDLVRAREL